MKIGQTSDYFGTAILPSSLGVPVPIIASVTRQRPQDTVHNSGGREKGPESTQLDIKFTCWGKRRRRATSHCQN